MTMKTILFYSQILSKSLREKRKKENSTLPTSFHPHIYPETKLQQTVAENHLYF